jgi:hypothetical protein
MAVVCYRCIRLECVVVMDSDMWMSIWPESHAGPRLKHMIEMEDVNVVYVRGCGVRGANMFWIQSLLL